MNVGGMVEGLKRRANDQHDPGSNLTRAILLCPWEVSLGARFHFA